jgi:hypothetical protein
MAFYSVIIFVLFCACVITSITPYQELVVPHLLQPERNLAYLTSNCAQ